MKNIRGISTLQIREMDASEENRRSSEMERKLRLARVARAKSGYGTSHHSDEIDGNRKMHAQRQRELKDKKDNDKHTQPERNGNQKMRVLEYRVSFDTVSQTLLCLLDINYGFFLGVIWRIKFI